MFELKLKDKTIPLKWGTWSMKRFTEIQGKELNDYFDMLSQNKFGLNDVISLLQAAAEYGFKKSNLEIDFGEIEICEWIDEVGGLNSEQLKGFFEYMVNTVVSNTTIKEDKKKVTIK